MGWSGKHWSCSSMCKCLAVSIEGGALKTPSSGALAHLCRSGGSSCSSAAFLLSSQRRSAADAACTLCAGLPACRSCSCCRMARARRNPSRLLMVEMMWPQLTVGKEMCVLLTAQMLRALNKRSGYGNGFRPPAGGGGGGCGVNLAWGPTCHTWARTCPPLLQAPTRGHSKRGSRPWARGRVGSAKLRLGRGFSSTDRLYRM